ncbi:MAG: Inner rane component of cytoplasmic domain [Myxococcaceae bacterium]|nr:Inner rane component of cytoplasmic domain [Myxococcaceae bacterium]
MSTAVATDLPAAPTVDARAPRMNLSHLLTRRYWLDAPHGRVAIGAWPVLIGRNPDCNLVLEQPEISRHHLLVRLGANGAEMLPLGRGPVRLNGTPCTALSPLAAGDRIEVGEWTFVVGEGEAEYSPRASEVAWCLERQSGLLHLVVASTFRVGGGAVDDLIVPGWEPTVFSLTLRSGPPVLTALREGVSCGHPLEVGERVAVAEDTLIVYRSEEFRVRARLARAEAETFTAVRPRHAMVAMLEFLPRGGRLTLEIGGRLHVAMLADRRCDLVASLLQPPSPLVAGDIVPDEAVCARVWPGERNGRTELNSLLYRLRQGLSDEGIDPALLFDRVGGGLRFCLASGARVIVR